MSDTSQKLEFLSFVDEVNDVLESESHIGVTAPLQTMSHLYASFCQKTLKEIKKSKFAIFFLEPVDPVKFNIPTYFDIIKSPMDLSTIESKLNNGVYSSIEDFENDFLLMFENCYLFNNKDDPVCKAARELQKSFNKKMKKAPSAVTAAIDTAIPSTATYATQPISDEPTTKSSISNPLDKSQSTTATDLDIVTLEEKSATQEDLNESPEVYVMPDEEYRHCLNAVKELKKPKYTTCSWPFLNPVDAEAWGLKDYHEIVSHPMDISTFEMKLKEYQYQDEKAFEADVRLMFNNCYRYNSDPENLVHKLGKELEGVFDTFWNSPYGKAAAKAKRKTVPKTAKEVSKAPQPHVSLGKRDLDDDYSYSPEEPSTKIRLKPPSRPALSTKTPGLALSQEPPQQVTNRPKLALTSLNSPAIDKKKVADKKPPVVLKNHEKWLAIGQKTVPAASSGTGADLFEKAHQERRQREEEKQRAAEEKKEREKERLRELKRVAQQQQERKEAKEKELRERKAKEKEAHLRELERSSINMSRQKTIFHRFEMTLENDRDWRDLLKRQSDQGSYRHLTVPGFVRRSHKSLNEVQSMLLSAQGRLQSNFNEEEGEADMDIE